MTASPIRLRTRLAAAVAVAGAFALAGCSSSKPSSSDGTRPSSSTTSRTASSASSTGSTTATCPTQAQATTLLGSADRATAAPECAAGYAAGSATDGQIDLAYILVLQGGDWIKASDAQTTEICTANPNRVPQQIIDAGCND